MYSDQSKSNPNQAADKAAPGNGKLAGNKDLHGKTLHKTVVDSPQKDTKGVKDHAKEVKKS